MDTTLTPVETAVADLQNEATSTIRFGALELTRIGITSKTPPEVADLLAAGQMIDRCHTGTNWWLGDILLYFGNTPGIADVMDQVIAGWSVGLKSIEQCRRVAQEWPIRLRDPDVSWAIHRAALGLNHMDDRLELLKRAKDEEMTVREATRAARELKYRRIAGTAINEPQSTSERYAFAIAEPSFWVPDGIVGLPGSPAQGRAGQKSSADWSSLNVCDLLKPDATVYILTTPTTLDEAISLAKKWGLVYRTVMSLSWEEPADTYYYHAANNQAMAVVATTGYPGRLGEPDGHSNHPDAVGARAWLYGHLEDLYAGDKGLAVFAKPPAEYRESYGSADLIGALQ